MDSSKKSVMGASKSVMSQRDREEERKKMSKEIDTLLHRHKNQTEETEEDPYGSGKKHQSRIGKLPEIN
jgi:hypothetical protein